jgi:hypothetical protein
MLADVALGPVAKSLGHGENGTGNAELRKLVIDDILS